MDREACIATLLLYGYEPMQDEGGVPYAVRSVGPGRSDYDAYTVLLDSAYGKVRKIHHCYSSRRWTFRSASWDWFDTEDLQVLVQSNVVLSAR